MCTYGLNIISAKCEALCCPSLLGHHTQIIHIEWPRRLAAKRKRGKRMEMIVIQSPSKETCILIPHAYAMMWIYY